MRNLYEEVSCKMLWATLNLHDWTPSLHLSQVQIISLKLSPFCLHSRCQIHPQTHRDISTANLRIPSKIKSKFIPPLASINLTILLNIFALLSSANSSNFILFYFCGDSPSSIIPLCLYFSLILTNLLYVSMIIVSFLDFDC